MLNIMFLKSFAADLHPALRQSMSSNQKRSREAMTFGKLSSFTEDAYILITQKNFTPVGRISLRCPTHPLLPLCHVIGPVNDYAYSLEDILNGEMQEVNGTLLKLYHGKYLDKKAIMSHVVNSRTEMGAQCVNKVDKIDGS